MKVTIVDMNNVEAFLSLEDGRILSVPISAINNSQIGDTLEFPQMNLSCSNNRSHSSTVTANGLIDFF